MALPVTVQLVVLICIIPFISSAKIKWCHTEASTAGCKNNTNVFSDFECVLAPNIYRCMEMLRTGLANVLFVSDTELYAAGQLGLKPLLQATYPDSIDYRYKAIAVVKAGGKIKKLSDLKNAKSCHTGAGKTTGWTIPVSNLIKKKILTSLRNCYSSTENIADFFMKSCVPGAMSKQYNPLNRNPARLCGLCKDKNCSRSDEYAGYDGAKLCLESTDADIAFVKHDTMLNANKTKYKLLCPDDKLMELDEYEKCNWGVRPADTIVVSPNAINTTSIADELILYTATLKKTFNWMKVSALNKTDKDYSALMGEGFKNTFENYHNCKSKLRWCAVGEKELSKCTDLKLAFMAKRATNKLECVKASDHFKCMDLIEQKKADFVVLDGGDLEIAMNNCKLQPVIAETYGFGLATYYTVAVVKANTTFNVKSLKGKKSCHTGIGKTSGWKSPVSYLIKNGMIEKGHSIAEEVGEFFSASCVPGALDTKYNPHGHNPKSLCELCTPNCERNSDNKYYDYSGAFRCLVEAGDVAFVKHTTVLESTDGKGTADWEKGLKSSDYSLLCKDGTRAPVSDWAICHFAKVPAHALVVRKGETELADLLYRIFNNFDLSKAESQELLFSSPGGKNLLFKDSTKGLLRIENPKTFLGKEYLEILDVFGEKRKVCSGSSHSTISVLLVLFSLVNYFA